MATGKYIVLEGGEGVGKTTQAHAITERLNSLGIRSETVREPGGDPLGEAIRGLLLDPAMSDTHPKAEVLLFNAARVQTLVRIRRKLERGVWVVSDRSYISTMAYQGFGRGMEMESLLPICLYAVEDLHPHVLLVLTCSDEETNRRRGERGVSDRFEQEQKGFHDRVNNGFLEIARTRQVPVIPADGSIEEVHETIWAHVEPLLKEA